MIKLVYFELKKILKNSFLLSMTLLFLFFNLISIHYQQIQKYEDPIHYSELYENKLNELKDEDDFYNAIENELNLTQDEMIYNILNQILDEKKSIDSYKEKIDSILIQSENMSGISIFYENEGSLSNIIKTGNDYKRVRNVELTFNNHLGLQAFLEMSYTELMILFLLIMAISVLIVNENNNGMNILINSTILGNRHTVIAKLIAMFIMCVFFHLLFYGMNLLYVNCIYGLNNLFDSIQSCQTFVDFTLPLNGLQMMGYITLYRIVLIYGFILIIFMLLKMFKNSILVSGMILCFMTLEAILHHIIPLQSNLSIFRYLNIFSVFNLDFSLYKYNNIILFDNAFSMKEIIPLLSICLTIISIFISILIKPIEINDLNRFIENISSKIKIFNHTHLFIHELNKSLIHNKGLVVLMLLMGYFIISIDSYERSSIDTPYELVLQEYGGELSEDKRIEITKLKEKIKSIQTELNVLELQMNQGIIEPEVYYKKYNETRDLMILSTGLNQLEEQILFLSGENLGIVDVYGYERLFDVGINNTRLNGVMINFIVLILSLILCISPIETIDKNKGINLVYVVSCFDENKIKLSKQMVVIFYVFVVNLIFNIWKYHAVSKYYMLDGGEFNVGSVPSLMRIFYENMSLYEAYNLIVFIRFIVLLLCAQIVLYFSNHNESIFVTILKSVSVLILPIMLIFVGFSSFDSILVSCYFTSVEAYKITELSLIKLLLMIIIIIIFIFKYFKVKVDSYN